MQKQPLVSIIIPVFNVAEFLSECLESVFNQTYPNIQVIVIDDGSTDESPLILKRWRETEEFILINQNNSGQSVSRNKGLEIAKGKYILFVDSDDYIDTNTVDILTKEIETNKTDIIRFNALPFKHNSNKVMKNKNYDFSNILVDKKVYEGEEIDDIYRSFSSSPCLYMFKRSLINDQMYFKPNIIHEDELFTIKLFFAAKKFSYSNNFFYHRRYRDFSTMTRKDKEQVLKSFDSYIFILKELQGMLEDHEISEIKKKFIRNKINSIYRAIYFYDIDKKHKQEEMNSIKKLQLKEFLILSNIRFKNYLKKIYKIIKFN